MKSPDGKPNGKGGFKGPGSRPPKPYSTRTYRRPAEGSPATEGFDASYQGDEAPKRYRPAGEGAKRPYSKTEGPKRPYSKTDGPKRPYTKTDGPKRPYTRTEGRPVDRRGRDDFEPRPARTWQRIEPQTEAPRPAPAAEVQTEPKAESKERVELSLTIPAAMLRDLESRARDIGVEVEPLVQVWLADKLSKR